MSAAAAEIELYPVPKTKSEKKEFLSAGNKAVDRLITALGSLDNLNDMEDNEYDIEYQKEMLLEAARDDAEILWKFIACYLPKIMEVETSREVGDVHRDTAYKRMAKAYRAGQLDVI